jgi:hypothetical protein
MAEAYTMRNDRQVNWKLVCHQENATCLKLKWGSTYEFDVLTKGVDECMPDTRFVPRYECWAVHGRPYDLIYVAVEQR